MKLFKKDRFRWVSDYGYGDKSWLIRDLTAEEALRVFNKETGNEYSELHEGMFETDRTYYLEFDDPEDVEDWDVQDS